jgi:hypothetical protein
MGTPILKGNRYPTAPDAWKGGIQLYDETVRDTLPVAVPTNDGSYTVVSMDNLSDNTSPDPGGPKKANWHTYNCVPMCMPRQGRWQVLFYYAVNEDKEIDYAISPDKLDEFSQNFNWYYAQAQTPQTPSPVKDGSSRLYGMRFPASADAWDGGIVVYPYAESDLPRNGYVPFAKYHLWTEFMMKGTVQIFRFVPYFVGNRARPRVLYYTAFSDLHQITLYAISPDRIDKFANAAASFMTAYWMTFPKTDYEAEAGNMQYHAMRGEWGSAARALGRSWAAAAKDPAWWMLEALPAAVGIIAAGAAAAAARGAAAASAEPALARLVQTQENVGVSGFERGLAEQLSSPKVFRHTLTADIKPSSFAQIEKGGVLNLSTGDNAKFGIGVYAWDRMAQGVGTYIDIEVSAGVAVETIAPKGETAFFRIVPATGNKLPVKIVGTNLTQEQIAFGRRMIATDLPDDPVAPPPKPSGAATAATTAARQKDR